MEFKDVTDEFACHQCGAAIHPEVDNYLETLTEFDGWGVGTNVFSLLLARVPEYVEGGYWRHDYRVA